MAGAGLDFVHVPVTEEALVRARLGTRPLDVVRRVAARSATGSTASTWSRWRRAPAGDRVDVHARVFVPGLIGGRGRGHRLGRGRARA